MNIAIDIGHARHTGAKGQLKGATLHEHALCKGIALPLQEALQQAGHEVSIVDYPYLTNAQDLNKAIATINASGAQLAISLHGDAFSNPAAHGAHVCYYSAAGKRLAASIAQHLCPYMPGRAEQVVQRKRLAILSRTRCTAVLIETGFITHEGDAAKLSSLPQAIAQRIAAGILDYINLMA